MTALAQGQFVCLETPATVNPPLVAPHYYAVLGYDPTPGAQNPDGGQFLLYNPHGIGVIATLAVPLTGPDGTRRAPLRSQTSPPASKNVRAQLDVGDLIQIDGELMRVDSTPVEDAHDTNYTIQVTRGYGKSTPSDHQTTENGAPNGTPTGIFLELP